MPPLVIPPGLPLERQWYLYNKIREFCPDEAKDIACPLPSQPLYLLLFSICQYLVLKPHKYIQDGYLP